MDAFEGYVFLNFLESQYFKCPARVFIIEEETENQMSPSIQHIPTAGIFNLPLDLNSVEATLMQAYPKYLHELEEENSQRSKVQSLA